MRYLWMPRLVERIHAAAAAEATTGATSSAATYMAGPPPENSSAAASSDSFGTPVSDLTECYNNYPANNNNNDNQDYYYPANNNNNNNQFTYGDQSLISPTGYLNQGLGFVEQNNSQWMDGGDVTDNLWNVDDVWFLQQQFNSNA